eukprot:3989636-Prymnesium_polylepis.1
MPSSSCGDSPHAPAAPSRRQPTRRRATSRATASCSPVGRRAAVRPVAGARGGSGRVGRRAQGGA